MLLHKMSPPRPRRPDFTRTMNTGTEEAVAKMSGGQVKLLFWVPKTWSKTTETRFPVVVNFHGGGFTLGTAGDDARWCVAVADYVGAVVVSVDYRRAPEFPFPTAVEDGADAVLWLAERADELKIDCSKMALSGFSSGANMCFTVPLKLQEELINEIAEGDDRRESVVMSRRPGMQKTLSLGRVLLRKQQTRDSYGAGSASALADSTSNDLELENQPTEIEESVEDEPEDLLDEEDTLSQNSHHNRPRRRRSMKERLSVQGIPIAIKAVVAWYPPVDYTRTRAQRRATAKRIDQQLPQIFTDLFDESYLQPPTMDMSNPYLSPGVAPSHMLAGLPNDLVIFGCEWDMLLDETELFCTRLTEQLGKNVKFHLVEGVPHGFDKAPNPIRQPPAIWPQYMKGCEELKKILES
jgi:putative ergosteryl-3beta-O-L-aspartate hydrolase